MMFRYLRNVPRRVLWPRPRLYRATASLLRRPRRSYDDTEVFIDGFPRSGNTFAEMMFRETQRDKFTIGHHAHHPVPVIEACRARAKTIVLIRRPEEAVLSWCASWGVDSPDRMSDIFYIYLYYYAALRPWLRDLVLWEFSDVTRDFKSSLRHASEKWNCALNVDFDLPAVEREAFRLIDERIQREDGVLTEIRVNRPSEKRAEKRNQLAKMLEHPVVAPARKRALAEYEEISNLYSAQRRSVRRAFVSIIPQDDFGIGHVYQYHRAVAEACDLNGWWHSLVTSARVGAAVNRPTLVALRDAGSDGRGRRVRKLFGLAGAARHAARLAHLATQGVPPILFIEAFTVTHLVGLVLGCLFSFRRPDLWVLLRYDYSEKPFERFAILAVCRAYQVLTRRLTVLTDSTLIAQELEPKLGRNITVVPIPVEALPVAVYRKPEANVLRAIWPGAPHAAKGRDVVKRLLRERPPAGVEVVLRCRAHSDFVQHERGIQWQELPPALTREGHVDSLSNADVVLLPYDSLSYRTRTSGLLVEAILCGSVPLVSDNTWLADQVYRLGLGELVMNWTNAGVWARVWGLVNDPALRSKLDRARQSYRETHSIAAFAAVIERTASSR